MNYKYLIQIWLELTFLSKLGLGKFTCNFFTVLKLLSLTAGANKVKFIDSYQFFACKLADVPKAFGFSEDHIGATKVNFIH